MRHGTAERQRGYGSLAKWPVALRASRTAPTCATRTGHHTGSRRMRACLPRAAAHGCASARADRSSHDTLHTTQSATLCRDLLDALRTAACGGDGGTVRGKPGAVRRPLWQGYRLLGQCHAAEWAALADALCDARAPGHPGRQYHAGI